MFTLILTRPQYLGKKSVMVCFFYFIMIKICCDERSLRESNFQVHNLTTYIPSLQVEFINNCIFSYNIHISCTIFVVSQKRKQLYKNWKKLTLVHFCIGETQYTNCYLCLNMDSESPKGNI